MTLPEYPLHQYILLHYRTPWTTGILLYIVPMHIFTLLENPHGWNIHLQKMGINCITRVSWTFKWQPFTLEYSLHNFCGASTSPHQALTILEYSLHYWVPFCNTRYPLHYCGSLLHYKVSFMLLWFHFPLQSSYPLHHTSLWFPFTLLAYLLNYLGSL